MNDGFVLDKEGKRVGKILHIAFEAEKLGWLDIGAKIREFVKYVQDHHDLIKEIKTMDQWHEFLMGASIPENWINMLHYNDVLQLFGATKEQCKALCAINMVPEDKEKGIPAENLDSWGIRILSKMVGMLSCDMCLTDFVILAVYYASHGKLAKSENEVVSYLKLMARNIHDPVYVKTLLRVDQIVCDAEGDDEHARILLEYVNSVQTRAIRNVIVQLPTEACFDELAKKYSDLNCMVFRDPDSRNGPAIKRLYKMA